MKLKKIKFGQMIALGFGIVLVLGLTANILGISGFANIEDRVDKANDVEMIVSEVLQMRRHEKDFMLRNDVKYITMVNAKVSNIIKIAENAREKHSKQEDKDEKNKIIENVRSYSNAFNKYVESEEKKGEKMEIMRASGHDVINSLNELHDILIDEFNQNKALNLSEKEIAQTVENIVNTGELEVLFLEIRKGEKDVIIFQEKKYNDKLEKNYQKVIESATALKNNLSNTENVRLAKDIIKALNEYKVNFDDFYALMQEQIQKSETMVTYAREVITLSETAGVYQKSRMFSEIDNVKSGLIIFALIAIILGIIIAFTITNSIVNGIKKVIAQFNSLITDVINGKLDLKGDSDSVPVDFQEIIVQTNKLIAAFVEPINVVIEYYRFLQW